MSRVFKIGKPAIPPIELALGMKTVHNVCQKTVGTKLLRMGVCHHAPDMADMKWQGKSKEVFYVATGSIKVAWDDAQGDQGEAIIREGEQIFLPKGYQYTLKATGSQPSTSSPLPAAPNVSAIKAQRRGRCSEPRRERWGADEVPTRRTVPVR
jgi:uncharacterized RmlC-like cupin family protein